MIFNAYCEQAVTVDGFIPVSCGHIFAKQGREICRPKGRKDWLLFYVVKGTETFYLPQSVKVDSGGFVLFAPHQKQHHVYEGNQTGEFYYIHFKCDGLQERWGLETSRAYAPPFRREFCRIFEDIIEEMLVKHPMYEQMVVYQLKALLTELARSVHNETNRLPRRFHRVAAAVQHINRYYDSSFQLEDYAKMCNMTKHHFLRVFEQVTGRTPLQYRNDIRLENAVRMLEEQTLSVQEIGYQTGFSSPAYFSTAFKRKYGVSPKQYKQL